MIGFFFFLKENVKLDFFTEDAGHNILLCTSIQDLGDEDAACPSA